MAAVLKQRNRPAFTQKNIISIRDLSVNDIESILGLAQNHSQNFWPERTLENKIILNLFLENSTRTRVSFEMAGLRLGAKTINVNADGSSVKKGECLGDTLKTLAAMNPDALVIRAAENDAAQKAAQVFKCPIINGGDGTNEHPTQALLDALTLRQRFGRLDGLTVAICGDIRHSRVARSNFLLLTKMGADVRLTGPAQLLPENMPATPDIQAAFSGADVIMMLRLQNERMEKTLVLDRSEYFKLYGLDAHKLSWAKPGAVIMHPGPLNRGVEIDGNLADDPKRSLILDQVKNGVALRMACLELLLT